MRVSLKNMIDLTSAIKFIESDAFWLFGAKEWQRVLYDYIPHKTDQLRQKNVKYEPKEIHYNAPHSNFIYYGMKMVDPVYKVGGFTKDGGETWFSRRGVKKVVTSTPLKMKNGSRLWDKKAISEKKDLILIRSMQNYIDKIL